MFRFYARWSALLVIGIAAAAKPVLADEPYPSKPIQIIVPTAKGGGVDTSFRLLSEALEPLLKQKVQVVNRPGNGGVLGLQELANAEPDGYTLGGLWNGPLTATPQVTEVGYTLDKFTAVASVTEGEYFLCAHRSFPADDGQSFVKAVREKPMQFTYGNDGAAGSGYFAAERVFSALQIFIRPVAADGTTEAAKNFQEGKVDFYVGTAKPIASQLANGSAKCLIVISGEVSPVLPNCTTLKSLGIAADGIKPWRLLLAPKGMPKDRVEILQKAVSEVLKSPKIANYLAENGEKALVSNSQETMGRLQMEYEAIGELADRLGVKKD
jgi:tripartite-type tricarboxylate transporter receptor subunit TctC